MKARPGVDHNVVIVGGGQNGVGIAYGLQRKGVGAVEVIDSAEEGQTGIWRTIAHMRQLRSPKTLPGPDFGNPALSFRGWYETLNGPKAFDALDRVPRLVWADYLDWYQQATGIKVRYRTRLLDIEPRGDVLRLNLLADGTRRTITTRKLILANGYAGAGGPNLPDYLRTLPSSAWTHTHTLFDYDKLAGKVVGVIGAASSAFDAAAVALESGASEVHMFSRRSYVAYPAPASPQRSASPPPDRGYATSANELFHELPDVVRWRTFLAGQRRVDSVPLDSLERAVAFNNFHLHLDSALSDVKISGKSKVTAKAAGRTFRFDHLIAATGYQVDLSAQPELARVHEHIALWRDRYRPQAGEENAAAGLHPYLGAGFEFLPRQESGADFVRNIHCFNNAGNLSFVKLVGDINSMIDHPRLVSAVASDLFRESVDTAAHERFVNAPETPSDPAPYQKALQKKARDAA